MKLLQIIEGTILHATANTSFLKGRVLCPFSSNYLGLYSIF